MPNYSVEPFHAPSSSNFFLTHEIELKKEAA